MSAFAARTGTSSSVGSSSIVRFLPAVLMALLATAAHAEDAPFSESVPAALSGTAGNTPLLQIRTLTWRGLSDAEGRRLMDLLGVRVAKRVTVQELSLLPSQLQTLASGLIVEIEAALYTHRVELFFRPQRPGEVQPAWHASPLAPKTFEAGDAVVTEWDRLRTSVVKWIAPAYPAVARVARQQGRITVEMLIAPEGAVEDVRVISGPPLLRQATRDALRRWTFKPMLVDGQPVRVVTETSVTFALE
jgi:TonB family protein